MTDLFFGTNGPQDAPIVLVGEAWGYEEAARQQPFMGESGKLLNAMLAEAGYQRSDILCTNVVSARPDGNEMWRFFLPKVGKPNRVAGLAPSPLVHNGVNTLYQQINSHPRKLVIAAGNYPLWALTDLCGKPKVLAKSNARKIPPELQTWVPTGIMTQRGVHGYMLNSRFENRGYSKTRILPVAHPANVMRDWPTRALSVHDFRARIPRALADDWEPNPRPVFWAPPTFQQAVDRFKQWLFQANTTKLRIVNDIETARSLITCTGFADSKDFAMSIPFIRRTEGKDNAFASWWHPDQEVVLVDLMRRLYLHPGIELEGQNYIYDTQFIQHYLAVQPRASFDSMLAQNVLFPGEPKDLVHLSSLYCRYHRYWKEDHKEWDLSGSIEDLLVYNCEDCVRQFEVGTNQRLVITQSGLQRQMDDKMRINDFCLRMMNRGVRMDVRRMGELVYELQQVIGELEAQLLAIVPQAMVNPEADKPWYRSSKQTAHLYYTLLGFDVVKDRKTGQPTVGEEARDILKRKYPEFSGIFFRLEKLGSLAQAINVLTTPLESSGRMVCSFNPAGTETHRLSSSENVWKRGTNLQNLTKGEEDE